MLDGTKSSVDHLVPKSEELLNKTQLQEKAISDIHTDLNEKTNAIMKELSEVNGKELRSGGLKGIKSGFQAFLSM